MFNSLNPVVQSPRLGPDVREPQPGVTAGHCRMFQALGVPDRTSEVPLSANPPVGQVLGLPRWSNQAPHPLHILSRLRVPLHLLRVTRFLLPNRQLQVGFRLALLDPLVKLVRLRSRRPATRRVTPQFVTPRPCAWLTSFMRSARILVQSRTLRV